MSRESRVGEINHQVLYDIESAAKKLRGMHYPGGRRVFTDGQAFGLGVYAALLNQGFSPGQAKAARTRILEQHGQEASL